MKRLLLVLAILGLTIPLMADQTMYLSHAACIYLGANNQPPASLRGIWNNSTSGNGSCSLNSNSTGDAATSHCVSLYLMTKNHHKVIGECDCFTYVVMLQQSTANAACTFFTGKTYDTVPDCGQ